MLLELRPRLVEWLRCERGLELKPGATRLNQRCHGMGFLGIRIFAGTNRLRRQNLKRSLCKLARREWAHWQGRVDDEALMANGQSLLANLKYWNTTLLRRQIFTGDRPRRLQPCHPGRQLEQQRDQPALCQPQQQHPVEHEQQHRRPSLQHP